MSKPHLLSTSSTSNRSNESEYHITVVGHSNVGKSSLIANLCGESSTENSAYVSIAMNINSTTKVTEKGNINTIFWEPPTDLNAQASPLNFAYKLKSLKPVAIFLLFDANDPKSLKYARKGFINDMKLKEIRRENEANDKENFAIPPVFLIRNKIDKKSENITCNIQSEIQETKQIIEKYTPVNYVSISVKDNNLKELLQHDLLQKLIPETRSKKTRAIFLYDQAIKSYKARKRPTWWNHIDRKTTLTTLPRQLAECDDITTFAKYIYLASINTKKSHLHYQNLLGRLFKTESRLAKELDSVLDQMVDLTLISKQALDTIKENNKPTYNLHNLKSTPKQQYPKSGC